MIPKEKREIPKRVYPNEPDEINEKKKEVNMSLSNPIFYVAYKDKVEGDMVKRAIAVQIILNILFGKSSKAYKELTDENLLIGTFDGSYESARDYAFVMIGGRSRNYEKVIEKVNEVVEEARKNGLNEADFSRSKKKVYGDYISEFNSVDETARAFLADFFKGINTFEYLEKYNDVTKEYTDQMLNEIFNDKNQVISIVK